MGSKASLLSDKLISLVTESAFDLKKSSGVQFWVAKYVPNRLRGSQWGIYPSFSEDNSKLRTKIMRSLLYLNYRSWLLFNSLSQATQCFLPHCLPELMNGNLPGNLTHQMALHWASPGRNCPRIELTSFWNVFRRIPICLRCGYLRQAGGAGCEWDRTSGAFRCVMIRLPMIASPVLFRKGHWRGCLHRRRDTPYHLRCWVNHPPPLQS